MIATPRQLPRKTQVFENVDSAAFLVQVLIAFGAGIISFLSPCVLPLLPGYLSMMSGYSAAQLERGDISTGHMTRVILLFIAGFTVVFVALGAIATGLRTWLVQNLDTFTRLAGLTVIVFGILMVVTAVSEGGVVGPLARERRVDVRPSRLGGWAPPVMGMAFGFAWTPCIGPVLTVILATASLQETLGQGMTLLFAYSLGLGIPFLLSGLGLFKLFGRLKPFLRPISIVSGVLLTLFGVVLVTGNISTLSNWFSDVMLSVPFLRELATI
jgi:cytochrome c-type biogenesis protein